MVDTLTQERRSWNMSRIQGKDTAPELTLRSMLHNAGYRFRLHPARLPGRPDIVLPRYRTAIFVNGCYWHRHHGCSRATNPKTRPEFWQDKFRATVERDRRKTEELVADGWNVITVWECDLETRPRTLLAEITARLNEVSDGILNLK